MRDFAGNGAADASRRTNVFVHVPYADRDRYLPLVLRDRVNPELYLSTTDLLELDRPELKRVRDDLSLAGLSCTIHGPYMDLSIGAFDPEIRSISQKRILQSLEVASYLHAKTLVLHPGYTSFKYSEVLEDWLRNCESLLTEVGLGGGKSGIMFALENTFESSPEVLCRLVDRLDPEVFGHCFDIGHFNVFARGDLLSWLRRVKGRLVELHLHDNDGASDQHLAIGEGTADFSSLFSGLAETLDSLVLTVEAHEESGVRRSLSALEKLLRRVE
jgi:sugar phosphate isomerase/epimerase